MTAKTQVTQYESIQEPLDEEERILMDPETWDWDSAYEVDPNPDFQMVFEVRLSPDDLATIEQAATAKGITVNAFLRYAALRCAQDPA